MAGLFGNENGDRFAGWLRERPPTARWGVFAAILIFAVAAFTLGYSSGKQDGYSSGYNVGHKAVCQQQNTDYLLPGDSSPMNFSAFLDWAGQVELPPVGWALLILFVLVILK